MPYLSLAPGLATMVSHRSTKGASKARRDHINHEIRNMRALLPISQEDQERLSYLHSMAAICTYIRKSVLFQGETSTTSLRTELLSAAFSSAHRLCLPLSSSRSLCIRGQQPLCAMRGVSSESAWLCPGHHHNGEACLHLGKCWPVSGYLHGTATVD